MTDLHTREQALGMGSYIVQAPAGSGKTELLTQRFLKLLATVDRPERVLAITFTRKATQEMRERIMLRLRQAAADHEPEQAHEREAVTCAAGALARSRELGWDLLLNPGRLQIQTIDGLCARISGRAPQPGSGVGGMKVVDDARPLYRIAAQRLIEDGSKQDSDPRLFDALSRVLVYVKGSASALQEMICSMLGRREQWLAQLAVRPADMEAVLAVQQLLELDKLQDALGGSQIDSLTSLLAAMAGRADNPDQAQPLLDAIEASGADPADTNLAVGMAYQVLRTVSTGSKIPYAPGSVKRMVLPTADGQPSGDIDEVKKILGDWRSNERAAAAFNRFVSHPPLVSDPSAAEVLGDFQLMLKFATAQLRVLFTERGRSDFNYVAEMALQALGDELIPGDALLREDLALQHILLDEFQDTSHTQYELLTRLVSGWQAGDGRSLFLVGDPMQSIYRFRKADVSLFLSLIHI